MSVSGNAEPIGYKGLWQGQPLLLFSPPTQNNDTQRHTRTHSQYRHTQIHTDTPHTQTHTHIIQRKKKPEEVFLKFYRKLETSMNEYIIPS